MNHQLAIIGQNFVVSWFAVFSFIGCLAGFLTACILRKTQKRYVSDVFIVMTFAVPFGLLFGRVFYCLFAASEYGSIRQMFRLSVGGYGLFGAMLGVFLAAVLAKKVYGVEGWGELLDCLAIGGALAITVGRFASYFAGVELGYEVPFKVLTIYTPEENIHVLAVYMLDGIYEAAVLLVCLIFYITIRQKKDGKSREGVGGLTAMLMLALHGTNAVIMESMRSDALKFGANDFIKVSQILGITCCVAVAVALIVMTIKNRGFRFGDVIMLLAFIGCIAVGVLAEWRVGKGDYIRKHLFMLASMVILDIITVDYGNKAALQKKKTAEESTELTASTEPTGQQFETGDAKNQRRHRISKKEAYSMIDEFKDSAHSQV